MERDQKERVQQLMIRLAAGDRLAFDPLFETLWPVVQRFAARALNGAPEAEDAAQVALLKVFSRAGEFDADGDAVSWVLGVVAYECKTFRRKQLRRREDTDALTERAGNEPSPEEAVIARSLELAAQEVLGTLRSVDIETLRAVMEGQRPEVPAATFRKRVERALGRLRTAWSSRHGID